MIELHQCYTLTKLLGDKCVMMARNVFFIIHPSTDSLEMQLLEAKVANASICLLLAQGTCWDHILEKDFIDF